MSNSIRLRKEMGIARPGLDSSPGSVSEMVNYGTNSSLWGLPWENSLSPESGEKIPIVVSASHSSSPWQSALKQNQGEKDWKQRGKVLLVFFCEVFFVFSFIFLYMVQKVLIPWTAFRREILKDSCCSSQYCSYTNCILCSQLLDRTWVRLENPEHSVFSLLSLLGCLLLSVSQCKECKIIFSSFPAGYFIRLYHSAGTGTGAKSHFQDYILTTSSSVR